MGQATPRASPGVHRSVSIGSGDGDPTPRETVIEKAKQVCRRAQDDPVADPGAPPDLLQGIPARLWPHPHCATLLLPDSRAPLQQPL